MSEYTKAFRLFDLQHLLKLQNIGSQQSTATNLVLLVLNIYQILKLQSQKVSISKPEEKTCVLAKFDVHVGNLNFKFRASKHEKRKREPTFSNLSSERLIDIIKASSSTCCSRRFDN